MLVFSSQFTWGLKLILWTGVALVTKQVMSPYQRKKSDSVLATFSQEDKFQGLYINSKP